MTQISLRQLGSKVRKMRLSDNSVVAIKSDTPLAESENLDSLVSVIEQAGFKNVIVVIVDNLEDISSFDERTMNKNGWFRLPQLSKIIARGEK